MLIIQNGILGCFLLIQSIFDIKSKRLPVWVTVTGGAVGIAFWAIEGDFRMAQLWGLLPGIICLLFARVSKEAMGYGDGLFICMMGIYLGVDKLISICLCALFLAGIVALILLVSGKRNGKQEIPFIPFLLLSFLFEVLLEW